MTQHGLFQIIYNYYTTSKGKQRVKKDFVFIEEFTTKNTMDFINNTHMLYNRYKNYNNLIILEYDIKYKGYLFNKSKNITLLLTNEKGILQEGRQVEVCLI